MRHFIATLFLILAFGMTAQGADNWQIIHAGKLLAHPGQKPLERQTVIVHGNRIEAVRAGFLSPADAGHAEATVVDLSGRFVMPGMIDSHVHLTGELNAAAKLNRVTQSDADVALAAAQFARRTVLAGFTTVRNVGSGKGRAIFALRDAIAAGKVPGPRILAAGSTVTPTGGHGDVHGYREDIMALMGSSGVCDGADDCRRAVRAQVKRGSDVIKITATGGVLSETAAGTGQQFTDDELRAIISTAHGLGRKVAAHAHGVDGINAALRAGIDSIEHGTYLNDESIKLFHKTGAYLVPTIVAGETVARLAKNSKFMPPPIRAKALEVGPRMLAMAAKAYKGGVKMAFGTDSGVSRHGRNARELVLMHKAGIPNDRILVMVTLNAADLLGIRDRVGSIESGKAADLIAVSGNPLKDISILSNVGFVMRAGHILKP